MRLGTNSYTLDVATAPVHLCLCGLIVIGQRLVVICRCYTRPAVGLGEVGIRRSAMSKHLMACVCGNFRLAVVSELDVQQQ